MRRTLTAVIPVLFFFGILLMASLDERRSEAEKTKRMQIEVDSAKHYDKGFRDGTIATLKYLHVTNNLDLIPAIEKTKPIN